MGAVPSYVFSPPAATFEGRLKDVLTRTTSRVGPETKAQLTALVSPGGSAFADWWGDITISTKGTANDQALALLHEKVHQFFVAKLYVLREYRVASRLGSYVRSSLYRYIEEMLAETIAQVGVNGFKQTFVGLRFPVKNGYVFLMKGGSSLQPSWKGSGVLVEGAALVRTGMVSGFAYELWFAPGTP